MNKITNRHQNSDEWETTLGAVGEESGSLTTQRQAVKDTRRTEQEAVASWKGTGENTRIQDARKNFDASTSHGNDEGWLGGISGVAKEVGIIGRDNHPDNQNSTNLRMGYWSTYVNRLYLKNLT